MEGRDATWMPEGYARLRRLGAGQTSVVHLARHARFGEVALKLPRDDLRDDPTLRRMFETEVVLSMRFDHPHVVRGLDGRSTGPGAYLALEYCAGGTLDQHLLERGRMGIERAVRIVEDVASGLAHVHARRVVHRDVKPANVFLDDAGRAKLGDFGTAASIGEVGDARVGTAFYMAPEIFEGRPATVRSDVYALGVATYEVVTGERPFQGARYEDLLHAHTSGVLRDPRAVRDGVPDALAELVRRAMARTPDARFEDVPAFLAALRAATGRPDPEAAAPRFGRASRRRPVPGGAEDEDAVQERSDDGDAAPRPWWRRGSGGES
ncbi:MAG: serine/threonine-protein kinase [Trueperaceae bacterium]|nr:serine/threonine-protein kinase [Trueperaceae bacterium]